MNHAEIEYIILQHHDHWDELNSKMVAYTNAYNGDMFTHLEGTEIIPVETPDAKQAIETMVASTYTKRAALDVGEDPQGDGDPDLLRECINQFLYDKNIAVERALRYALLYPFSFFKLGLSERESALDSIEIRAVEPWDVIVDLDAHDYFDSRYVGHRYFVPYPQAKKQFGGVLFTPVLKRDYLSGDTDEDSALAVSELLGYVEIYEIYDLMNDELVFYSPNARRENKIVDTVSPIPFRRANGDPLPSLVPVYLSYAPDCPLKGSSAMKHIYPQLWEKNSLRTVQANAIRKNARQYLIRAGSVSQEAYDVLQSNIDQSFVELDLPPDQNLSNAIVPLPTMNLVSDFSQYEMAINSDIERSSAMLNAMTRGEASNITATEAAALTQYISTSAGRIARFFHGSIEFLGEVYQSMLLHLLVTEEDDKKEIMLLAGEPRVLRPEAFKGDFKFTFSDQAAAPIAGAIKQRNLLELLPALQGLGVPNEAILDHLIDLYDLPDTFRIEAPPVPQAPEGAVGAPSVPGVDDSSTMVEGNAAPVAVGGGDLAAAIRSGGPVVG